MSPEDEVLLGVVLFTAVEHLAGKPNAVLADLDMDQLAQLHRAFAAAGTLTMRAAIAALEAESAEEGVRS